jgi:uncharacterized protein (TIGR00251 family)
METCKLKVKAVPNATANAVAGRLGDAWKIRLHAPPEDGKANKALLDFLSEKLALPRTALALAVGNASREKLVSINGLSLSSVEARLAT